MDLSALLRAHGPEAVDDAYATLERWRLRHYSASGPQVTRERLAALAEAVLASMAASDLHAVQAHATEVAHQRFHAGFGLAEVQTAFNALEEAFWRRVVRERPVAEQAGALALVATIFGAGKDRLALAYVALASGTHEPALDVGALFHGTLGDLAAPEAPADR